MAHVFLTGIVPAAVALAIRMKVREPEGWKPEREPRTAPTLAAK